jgi:HEAT repeat protein
MPESLEPLKAHDPLVRARALAEHGMRADRSALDVALPLLCDEDARVQFAAIRCLDATTPNWWSSPAADAAVPGWYEIVGAPMDGRMVAIAVVLMRRDSDGDIDVLLPLLLDGTYGPVLARMLLARRSEWWESARGHRHVPKLAELLLSQGSGTRWGTTMRARELRLPIVTLLGRTKDRRAISALIKCGVMWDMTEVAIRRLRSIADDWRTHSGALALVPWVSAVAKNEKYDWTYRRDALKLLGEIGDPSALADIAQCLHDKHETIQCYAVEALRSFGPQSIDVLVGGLSDTLLKTQKCIEAALDALDADWPSKAAAREQSTALLVELAKTDSEVAARSLERLWGKDYLKTDVGRAAVTALVKVRSTRAISMLGDIGDCAAIPTLALCLGDEWVHDEALAALEKIDPSWYSTQEARSAAPSLCASFDREVRARSGRTFQLLDHLGRIGGDDALMPVILVAFRRTDWRDSDSARHLLEDHSPLWRSSKAAKECADIFAGDLGSEDVVKRQIAARALVEIADARHVDVLLHALSDEDRDVARAAANALAPLI